MPTPEPHSTPAGARSSAATGAAPADARAARAERFAAARSELAAATVRGEGGRHALRQYSNRMDALVQQLFADAGAASQPVAVFALGGYGRRELCLHSVMFVIVLFA
jgi:[protein-PII] uridylyltransferase